ncbi:coiled-coil domain-containing protein 63-like [Chironomus tepperi]|uniref:coiled-coil domain-containing protein 63-like n=1 Tax=Chironomus tepperi TaxID=113505 RepID=UPI00391F14BF
MTDHARHLHRLRRRKVNYLNTKIQDEKLSRIFINTGRKKRIEILRAEVYDLDLRLKVASGKLHMKETEDNYREIERNLRLQEEMDEKIKKTKIEIGHIKTQMDRLERKSVELDRETEAEVPFLEHLKRANRQLEIHENRLQVSRQREGKMTAENQQLRELLCNMLYSRSIFNIHWNQIVDKLKNRKKFLLDMIERSSTAFNQDADLMDNYKKLLSRRNQDREMAVADMLKMQRQIDANDLINMFLKQKGKNRPFAPLDKHEVARRKGVKETYNNRLNFYEHLINEIKKYPLESIDNPLEKTVEYLRFVDNENYEYYRYREAMDRRLDDIENMTKNAANEIDRNHVMAENIRQYYKDKIEEREQTLQSEINTTVKYKMENDELIREVERYSKIFFSIMKTLRVDMTEFKKLLRKQNIMDHRNLDVLLSMIENRMNKIIAFLYCKQRENVDIQTVDPKLIVRSLKYDDRPVVEITDVVVTNQCPECAQTEDVNLQEANELVQMLDDDGLRKVMINKTKIPGLAQRMHTLSSCNLPRSGMIASRRYAE